MRFVICQLFLTLFLFVAPASAQTAVDPRLQGAIDTWLTDDDEASLPIMAELGMAGDRTAQFLISQIERETPPGGETEWVLALDRNARKSMFRAPGGLSGTSWVKKFAKEGDPLAMALEASKLPDATMDTAKALYAAGEVEQAKRLTWEILERGRFYAILSLSPEEPIFAALDYVPWMQGWFLAGANSAEQRKWIKVSASEGRLTGLILVSRLAPILDKSKAPRAPVMRVAGALKGAAQELLNRGGEEVSFAANLMERQARRDMALAPAKAMCERMCPNEVGACILGSVALLGGMERVMIQHTPYEALIPQETYMTSLRAEKTLERRLYEAVGSGFAGGTGYQVSQCLAETLVQ